MRRDIFGGAGEDGLRQRRTVGSGATAEEEGEERSGERRSRLPQSHYRTIPGRPPRRWRRNQERSRGESGSTIESSTPMRMAWRGPRMVPRKGRRMPRAEETARPMTPMKFRMPRKRKPNDARGGADAGEAPGRDGKRRDA